MKKRIMVNVELPTVKLRTMYKKACKKLGFSHMRDPIIKTINATIKEAEGKTT